MKDEYSEVIAEIAAMYADMIGDDADDIDMEELSDDAMMQFIKKANEICESHNVPRGDRAEVIGDGFERYLKESIEAPVEQFRYQLQLIYSL